MAIVAVIFVLVFLAVVANDLVRFIGEEPERTPGRGADGGDSGS